MATKTASKKKQVKKTVARKAKPVHPLMLDSKSWNKQKVMDILCKKIASSTSSIITLLGEGYEGNSLPDYTTIKAWLSADESISTQYARAKEDQAEFMAEEMLDIADNGDNDYMLKHGADGSEAYILNGEHVQRSKLRLEARKWLMSKLKPKKYGDRINLDHAGSIGIEKIIAEAGGDAESN